MLLHIIDKVSNGAEAVDGGQCGEIDDRFNGGSRRSKSMYEATVHVT